ncbi:MAG: patatin-like phospholipase family protein [Ilumatobacteraceae bacterium]
MATTLPTLCACAYGGGGLFGIAYLLGVGEALVDGGVALGRRRPSAPPPGRGPQAAPWHSASAGTAIDLIGDDIPRLPDPCRAPAADRVEIFSFGTARVPTMRAVVCSLPRLQEVVLHGADHDVADLVAASSAVPGMLAPHKVGGRRYVDGGVRSMASADLADPASNLLVMAPIAGPMFGPAGRLAERVLRREMRDWRQRHPDGHLWLIRPNRSIAELAGRPDQLFEPDRARRAYDLAYAGDGILERWTGAYGPDGPSSARPDATGATDAA